jgi:uncharacterized protein YndB with AHSA1/START domain
MVRVEASVLVRAPPHTVWEIVSDLDSEPTYWKGTKSIRNISRDGDTLRREITIAFRDKRCVQTVRLHPPHTVEFEFTDGIIQGSKTVTVSGGGEGATLTATWDIRFTGMMGMFGGAITGHIKKGTRQALEAIKSEAEGRAPDT